MHWLAPPNESHAASYNGYLGPAQKLVRSSEQLTSGRVVLIRVGSANVIRLWIIGIEDKLETVSPVSSLHGWRQPLGRLKRRMRGQNEREARNCALQCEIMWGYATHSTALYILKWVDSLNSWKERPTPTKGTQSRWTQFSSQKQTKINYL